MHCSQGGITRALLYGSAARSAMDPIMCPPSWQGVPNNYETDLIFPIVQAAARLANVDYHAADATTKTALKVGGGPAIGVLQLALRGYLTSRGFVPRLRPEPRP